MGKYEALLTELNAAIWDYAELRFHEYHSSEAIIDLLKAQGFTVKTNLAGMETAFTATAGSGHPVIGFLAEFDALSGLSQQAGVAYPAPRPESENGHGCGHSLLGVGAVGAALLLRDYLAESQKSGTVFLVGCPAEEGGSGKAYLARAGVFDGLDIALTWHPGGGHAVMTGSMQANCQACFQFSGVSAHASSAPHLGRSALDAVELMDVGANYMREHMESTDRIHYAILDTGGKSPNVVQNHAEVLYLIRSVNTQKVNALYERVCKIARGAAMMTETEVKISFDKACSNTISNGVLEQLLYESMKRIPLPVYSEEEISFAQKIKKVVTELNLDSDMSMAGLTSTQRKEIALRYRPLPMTDFVVDYQHLDVPIPGSSDVGDCSHVVPTAQFVGACFVPGTPAHSWQTVAQGKSGAAVKGMLYAASVLADAATHVIDDPSIAERAKEEFDKVTEGKPYICPIPPEIKPNQN
ncbi:MAG: amidohydrolase [Lawsonibacter sp.]|nr:amidohydrolase [Lawsonibacter sp.]